MTLDDIIYNILIPIDGRTSCRTYTYHIIYLLYYTYQYIVMRRNPVTRIYRHRILYCKYHCRCAAKANPSNYR